MTKAYEDFEEDDHDLVRDIVRPQLSGEVR